MKNLSSLLMFLGRMFISSIFLIAVTHKIADFEAAAAFMKSKDMGAVSFFLYSAIIVEFLGSISLILGFKTRVGAFLLLLFLLPVTYIFHDFWSMEDPAVKEQQIIHFFSNLGICGGLLYVLAFGGGEFALSHDKSWD